MRARVRARVRARARARARACACACVCTAGRRALSCGLQEVPQMALNDSGSMRHCGTLVRTKGTAPKERTCSRATRSGSPEYESLAEQGSRRCQHYGPTASAGPAPSRNTRRPTLRLDWRRLPSNITRDDPSLPSNITRDYPPFPSNTTRDYPPSLLILQGITPPPF